MVSQKNSEKTKRVTKVLILFHKKT